MSKNIFCHICDSNFAYKEYQGPKLLDEFGNKPCTECISEDEANNGPEDDGSEYQQEMKDTYE